MRKTLLKAAAVILGLHMLNASVLHADEAKVPDKINQELRESEKMTPEQEKTEAGEASGNVEDCEQANESDDAVGSAENKDLDDCKVLVK